MTNDKDLTPTSPRSPSHLAAVAEAANGAAAAAAFMQYRRELAEETLRRQKAGLALFAGYLAYVGMIEAPARRDLATWLESEPGREWANARAEALATTAAPWAGVEFGIVEGFKEWMLKRGYAVGSVNARLSTVKNYADLAAKAGAITAEALTLIQSVRGIKKPKRVDKARESAALPTRRGWKKAEAILLETEQAAKLKQQPATPQGRRDRLIVCLFLEHWLRVSELANLQVTDIDLKTRLISFSRPKTDKGEIKIYTHWLNKKITGEKAESYSAATAYFSSDALPIGPLLRGSKKNGELTESGMSTQKISARIRTLGERIGIYGLSPHDLRHYGATEAARAGAQIDILMEWGGWSNPLTPLEKYIHPAKIARTMADIGVKLE